MAKYISDEEYQQNLQQQFSELTPEDLVNHINKSETYLSELGNDIAEDRYEFIKSVCNTARQMDELTFKQWKALSAFNRDCARLQQTVTLKKSLSGGTNASVDIKPIPYTLPSGGGLDTSKMSKEKREAYEQYLSKQRFSAAVGADIEKFLDNYFKKRDIEERFGNKYEIDVNNGTAKTKKKSDGNNN